MKLFDLVIGLLVGIFLSICYLEPPKKETGPVSLSSYSSVHDAFRAEDRHVSLAVVAQRYNVSEDSLARALANHYRSYPTKIDFTDYCVRIGVVKVSKKGHIKGSTVNAKKLSTYVDTYLDLR